MNDYREPEEHRRASANLNTATREELLAIEGLSEGDVDGILKYRDERGEFKKYEELMFVKGFDRNRVASLSDRLVLHPPAQVDGYEPRL
jgi:competence protein ComEA